MTRDDTWAALAEFSKQKRRNNKEASVKLLDELHIPYETHNNGVHLIIKGPFETVDFWPSTGLWVIRESQARNRGVKNLIKFLKR